MNYLRIPRLLASFLLAYLTAQLISILAVNIIFDTGVTGILEIALQVVSVLAASLFAYFFDKSNAPANLWG